MTAFITHCWKNARIDLSGLLAAALLLLCGPGLVWAQAPAAEISRLRFDRTEDALLLSANIKFELPAAVEDALLKGVAMVFVAETSIYRKRWYWINKRVAGAERHMRLSYQALTRRWRLNIASGVIANAGSGVTLNQNFDSLEDALASMRRLSRWKVADIAEFDFEQSHIVSFSFGLDISQLPRPFQIGTLGQSEWNIAATVRQPLILEANP
jgi:Domain of unknown function (DUF4390)